MMIEKGASGETCGYLRGHQARYFKGSGMKTGEVFKVMMMRGERIRIRPVTCTGIRMGIMRGKGMMVRIR
jgi:hypothetical protein